MPVNKGASWNKPGNHLETRAPHKPPGMTGKHSPPNMIGRLHRAGGSMDEGVTNLFLDHTTVAYYPSNALPYLRAAIDPKYPATYLRTVSHSVEAQMRRCADSRLFHLATPPAVLHISFLTTLELTHSAI